MAECKDCDEGNYCPPCWDRVLAEHAWMANAVKGQAGLGTYAQQMQDAGRGHLLREDER